MRQKGFPANSKKPVYHAISVVYPQNPLVAYFLPIITLKIQLSPTDYRSQTGDSMSKKSQAGFTMIEMLVVMVVLGVLATIAIPTFSRWYPNYRLRTATREIYSTIQAAKMTAVKENTNVVVWFDKDNETFGAFVDSNGDNSKDAGERSLKDGTLHEDLDLYDIGDFNLGTLTFFDNRGLANGGWGNVKLMKKGDPNSRRMRIGIWLSGTVEISESTDAGASWS
jgi:prepilin-type N-terminal cleavage/methylation domain-containing protein